MKTAWLLCHRGTHKWVRLSNIPDVIAVLSGGKHIPQTELEVCASWLGSLRIGALTACKTHLIVKVRLEE